MDLAFERPSTPSARSQGRPLSDPQTKHRTTGEGSHLEVTVVGAVSQFEGRSNGRACGRARAMGWLVLGGLGALACSSSKGGSMAAGGASGASNAAGGSSAQSGAGGAVTLAGAAGVAGVAGAGGDISGMAGAAGTAGTAGAAGAAGAVSGSPLPILNLPGGMLKVEVCAENVVRVAFASAASFFTRSTLAAAPKQCVATPYTTSSTATETDISTAKLKVAIDTATGAITFSDPSGQVILAEQAGGGRTLTAATVHGEATNNVRQQWAPNADESLYGLGQHQHGLLDIKDTDLDLHQYNTEIVIPFFVSSRGYGILWDNTSFSRFGDLGAAQPLPGLTGLYATGGELGDVVASSGVVNFNGNVVAKATGDYTFRSYSSGTVQLSINGKLVIDHYRQGWLPNEDIAHVQLTAGQSVPVHLQWSSDIGVNILRLLWKPPVANRTTSLWSQVGDGIDYYFVYGPELDTVVGGYRRLTGQAPMMPSWAYGLWQSREHYQSATDLTDALQGYRTRNAPIDNIVQDWQYWLPSQWGSHQFDPARYPDPAGMIKTIHDTYHARFMISVWPKFYTGIANFTALNATPGYLYQPNLTEMKKDFVYVNTPGTTPSFTFYDAFNAGARNLYWSQINSNLFSKSVDAWWMDATEPEVVEGPFTSVDSQVNTNQTHMNPTALGSGSRMLNAFSLVNSQAVYEGQRAAAANQRVFILTRNGFAGQQRYAAASWSGDISSTWTALKKQIPAGLGFSVSGMPYWTLDSGGFAVPPRFAAATPTAADTAEWRELNTRWFEYATFLPILRIHGQAPLREIWQFGGDTSTAYQAMLKFDRLRYRLLPYIYSLAGAVTQHAGTLMRPLVMDFRSDAAARKISDQYMFGPALLVSPITSYNARSRSVYLPAAAGWYDFWTGAYASGGATVSAAAAFDSIPVYARAGSIIPVGPELQYTGEKPADPITLFLYAGADGSFDLYEDQGLTYDYEHGEFSTIPLHWNDATRTLTIGARSGTFAGMLASRTFQVVLISPSKAVGFSFTPLPDKTVTYTGAALDVTL
jgi:alpha-D-xyloside xylohydrolase